jgi:HAD superfamily hydrolase (TIGR01509 family)
LHQAVFIDALGTMIWLRPPWRELDPAAVAGIAPERVEAAFLAEMSYYLARSDEGSDPDRLADLRRRCAAVLSQELDREVSAETMMEAIRFEPFAETEEALRRLRDQGLRIVCVSNWDCSLPHVLERLGLAELLDGVVTSATAGARKPDPRIFAPALELAGCEPGEAIHVGDSNDDVAAAEAAGVEALLIDRSGGGGGEGVLTSLLDIGKHLRR